MVAVSGVSVNVGMLPRRSLFTLFLGAQMTQPLFYLSRSGVTVMSIRVPVTIGTDWDRQTRQGTWPTGVLLDVRLHYSTVWCRHTWTGYRWVNSSTTVAAQRKLVIHKSCPERRVSSPWTLSDYSYAIACIRLGILKLLQRTGTTVLSLLRLHCGTCRGAIIWAIVVHQDCSLKLCKIRHPNIIAAELQLLLFCGDVCVAVRKSTSSISKMETEQLSHHLFPWFFSLRF